MILIAIIVLVIPLICLFGIMVYVIKCIKINHYSDYNQSSSDCNRNDEWIKYKAEYRIGLDNTGNPVLEEVITERI